MCSRIYFPVGISGPARSLDLRDRGIHGPDAVHVAGRNVAAVIVEPHRPRVGVEPLLRVLARELSILDVLFIGLRQLESHLGNSTQLVDAVFHHTLAQVRRGHANRQRERSSRQRQDQIQFGPDLDFIEEIHRSPRSAINFGTNCHGYLKTTLSILVRSKVQLSGNLFCGRFRDGTRSASRAAALQERGQSLGAVNCCSNDDPNFCL